MSFLILLGLLFFLILAWRLFYSRQFTTLSEKSFLQELTLHENNSRSLRLSTMCHVDKFYMEQSTGNIRWVNTFFEGRCVILRLDFVLELIIEFCVHRSILFSKIVSTLKQREILDLLYTTFRFIRPSLIQRDLQITT
jgi:hypothetical protein